MDRDRLFHLLDLYVESELAPAEARELERLLAGSPEARKIFWSYLHHHVLVRKVMVGAQGRQIALAEGESPLRIRRAARRSRRPVFWIAAAAGFILLAAGAIFFRPGAPQADPRVETATIPEREPPVPPPERSTRPPAAPTVEARSPGEGIVPQPPEPPPARPPKKKPTKPERPPEPDRPQPEPAPPRPRPVPDEPPPLPRVPSKSAVVLGKIEDVRGEVEVTSEAGRAWARQGQPLLAGQGFATDAFKGYALLSYTDGTRVELGPGTRVREVNDEAGKTIALEQGSLWAVVSKQPAGRPLVVATPNAEARILGTSLRVVAGPGTTRLHVREGKVSLVRRKDGQSVEVAAGYQAAVAPNIRFAAKRSREEKGLVALYRFNEMRGDLVRDVSGFGVPLDLGIRNMKNVTWKSPGLEIRNWTTITSEIPADKIVEACRKSGELTLETWVVPGRASFNLEGFLVTMGNYPRFAFSLSQGPSKSAPGPHKAFVQAGARRVDHVDRPKSLATQRTVLPRLTHVVYTRNASGGELIYVNGQPRVAGRRQGDFSAWDGAHARLDLALEWVGEFRLVAIYARALPPKEVARNFKTGLD